MIREINIEDALPLKDLAFIDVRSESEYEIDTIPGAINVPILNNSEREHVGYIYTQVDKDEAKKIGLKYASAKLVEFYEKAKNIEKNNKHVALFCYRGGMRSNSVANVLDTMGINLFLVRGGYKSYRKYVLEELVKYEGKYKFIVLHGYTGAGKTKILKMLEKLGKSVLDLESLARNAGSVFGNIAFEGESNSQKKFESLLLNNLENTKDVYVFTESESKRVGKAVLPEFLFHDMENGYHVLIETTLEKRVENIVDDYVSSTSCTKDMEIKEAIDKLRKKIGGDKANTLIEELNKKNYSVIARELMRSYYDPLYKYSIEKLDKYDKIVKYTDIEHVIKELTEYVNTLC
ncbi:tRNA 2-selenouridine(34) synthase MnmH [Proteiniborus sp. MB09-C3]|uniref:tRNA 2-selenouridine(34) synthase MnmH n=1 Tax=Proteiniborus sp. MB09-C3 TaxID=3050072 RepID=UPI00255518DD|nr:tRNA 2-selenouridine(34) synthase MnmH [Proteiniborus sp. MB09-C3]WIV10915.1 tRNA 2-selenouridine(34) synthase MnmH [Proteiniborus sp. MB09-C3]